MLGFPVIQKMDFPKLKTEPKGQLCSVPRLQHSELTGSINLLALREHRKAFLSLPNATRCKKGLSPKCTPKKGNEARKDKRTLRIFQVVLLLA